MTAQRLDATAPRQVAMAHVLRGSKRYPFLYPLDLEWRVRPILEGKYAPPRMPADEHVHRILDVGANCGEFLVAAWSRWPRAWVDWIELNDELAAIAQQNATPGSQRVTMEDALDTRYDVVRFGAPMPRMWDLEEARICTIYDWMEYEL